MIHLARLLRATLPFATAATAATAVMLAACAHGGTTPSASSATSSAAPKAIGALRGSALRIGTAPGKAETPDTSVAIRMENVGDTRCVLRGYTLKWGVGGGGSLPGGGAQHCKEPMLAIPGHGALEVTCVLPSSTQLGAAPGMTVENTSIVDVEASCDAP